jgi:deoxyribose-phosphate aldolase
MHQHIEAIANRLIGQLTGSGSDALGSFLTSRQLEVPAVPSVPDRLAPLIDHTLLKPEATSGQIRTLCAEAREHGFASVCVNPAEAVPKVCTVVGFPLGATSMRSKALETQIAVSEGAQEIDMVLAVGRLRGGEYDYVLADIAAVVEAASGRRVKVIIETSLLTADQKIEACLLAAAGHAHYVKTSTGFSGGGATVDDIRLMRAVVGGGMGVKASGGVRDAEAARALVAVGATRLGTSSGVAIVKGTAGGNAY